MSKNRSARALSVDARLRSEAVKMLEDDQTLSARALAKRAGLSAASSITRDPVRRALLEEVQQQQERRRGWATRAKKGSLGRLQHALAERDTEIARLRRRDALLVASHKAMLLAVDEAGGTKAWAKFFNGWRTSVEALTEALPSGMNPIIGDERPRRAPRQGWRRY